MAEISHCTLQHPSICRKISSVLKIKCLMNSIFPTQKKKKLKNSFFIVVHENDMLVPTWELGHMKNYALCFLLCPWLGQYY